MAATSTPTGIVITHPDDYVVDAASSEPPGARGRRGRRGPAGHDRLDGGDEILAIGLGEAGFALDDSVIVAAPGPPAGRRGKAAPDAGPVTFDVPIAPDRDVVLLVEADGVLHWVYPTDAAGPAPARRRTGVRMRHFSIGEAVAAPRRGRGARRIDPAAWIADKVFGTIKAYVLSYAVGQAVEVAARLIDGNGPFGLAPIVGAEPTNWSAGRPVIVPEKAGRPLRVLLFVHGTFSSTRGGFGALAATPAGLALLARAAAAYDLVLGFDHKTLADTPAANARALVEALAALAPPEGLDIDACTHSRGGLVLRMAIEVIGHPGLRFKKAVFVACTLAGTHLADPANWGVLTDLYTNLTIGAASLTAGVPVLRVITAGAAVAVPSLGRFVQLLARAAIGERHVPGLAAMQPGSAVIKELEALKTALATEYFTVSSDFDPSLADRGTIGSKLASQLADRIADDLFGQSNDLVVDTASMEALGTRQAATKFGYGKTGTVWHSTYFGDNKLLENLAAWLALSLLEPSAARPPRPRRTPPATPTRRGRLLPPPADVPAAEAVVDFAAPDAGPGSRRSRGEAMPPRQGIDKIFGGTFGGPGTRRAAMPVAHAHGEGARGGTGTRPAAMPTEHGHHATNAKPPASAKSRTETTKPPAAAKSRAETAEPPTAAKSGAEKAKPATVTCDFAAEMPPTIQVAQAVDLTVTIARAAIEIVEGKTAKRGEGAVDPQMPLTVKAMALGNCRIIAPDHREIDVPLEGKKQERFKVQGLAVGPAKLSIDIRQNARSIITFTLEPMVVQAADVPLTRKSTAAMPAQPKGSPLVLRIYEVRKSEGSYELLFNADCRRPPLNRDDRIVGIDVNLDAYAADRYKEIEDAWSKSPGHYDDFMINLQAAGADMASALIPQEILRFIAERSDQIDAIQVISDKGSLPWEVAFIRGPGGRGGRYLAEYGLVRWLPNRPWASNALRLNDANVRLLVPTYAEPTYQLSGATKEKALLRKRFAQAVDLAPNLESLVRFLEAPGAIDVLHAACHGEVGNASTLTASVLLSAAKVHNRIETTDLRHTVVKQHLDFGADGAPIVFLNACQAGRPGRALVGTGGFAHAFLTPDSGNGASVFIAPLWTVADIEALSFAQTFYQELQEGKSLVEAVKAARRDSRNNKEVTWLSYSVYGDPYAGVAST